jgi:hypothetical protein
VKITLKGIANAISTVGWALVKIVLEITPFLRQLLPSMKTTWDEIEAMIRAGGISGARYVLDHLPTFEGMLTLGDRLIAIGTQLKKTAQMVMDAAQSPAEPGGPPIFDIPETEAVLEEIGVLKDLLVGAGEEADAALPMLLSMAKAGPVSDVSQSPTLNA